MVAGLPCLTSCYGAEYKNVCGDSRRPSLTADCVRPPPTGETIPATATYYPPLSTRIWALRRTLVYDRLHHGVDPEGSRRSRRGDHRRDEFSEHERPRSIPAAQYRHPAPEGRRAHRSPVRRDYRTAPWPWISRV